MTLTQFELDAIALSLKVAFFALLWLIPMGIGLGWLLARKQFFGKSVIDAVIHLPLILPPVVVGYLLLVTFGRYGWLGEPLYRYLGIEFGFQKIPFIAQSELSLEYRGQRLEQTYKPDFVCFEKIILELKAVSNLIDEHRAQLLNYLHATGFKLGLLINFGHHPKLEHERFIL